MSCHQQLTLFVVVSMVVFFDVFYLEDGTYEVNA